MRTRAAKVSKGAQRRSVASRTAVSAVAQARARGSADARRDAIREILARHAVATQEELARELAVRGIAATQATVSRDLVQLGITRLRSAGGARYQAPADDGMLPIDPVRRLVDSVLTNGVTVVVRTKAGAASTVARAIDDARVPGLLGTLAGDDTVFVAPASARGGAVLAQRLRKLLAAQG